MRSKDLDWAQRIVDLSLDQPRTMVIEVDIRETANTIALLDIARSLRRIAAHLSEGSE